MKVLILGYGQTGKSVHRFLTRLQADVVICEEKSQEKAPFMDFETALHWGPDLCVTSPGIGDAHPWIFACRSQGIPVYSDIELGLRYAKKLPTLLGVTGTNGKTTVTLLAEHILKEAGLRVRAVGNVGEPFLDHLGEGMPDYLVVELSSFQIDRTTSAKLSAGILLNVSPDHLDRYSSYHHYVQSKCRMGELVLPPSGHFYVRSDVYTAYPQFLPYAGLRTFGSQQGAFLQIKKSSFICEGKEYHFPTGAHLESVDRENLAAASCLVHEAGIQFEQAIDLGRTFKKPPHRLEYVAEIAGVTYHNDSKATNVDAVERAVHSLSGPIILIAGGVSKGEPYSRWQELFKKKVLQVYAIGESASSIASDLKGTVPVKCCKDLEEAVQQAERKAKPGMQVLLSPGCSSYDMFRDYIERGNRFKSLVRQIQA